MIPPSPISAQPRPAAALAGALLAVALAGCVGGGHPAAERTVAGPTDTLATLTGTSTPPVGLGGVGGNVTGTDSLPLPGVHVRLGNAANTTALTNEQGEFAIPNVAPGTYTARFHRRFYVDVVRTVEVRLERYTWVQPVVLRPGPDDQPFKQVEEPCSGYLALDVDGSQVGGNIDPNQKNRCRWNATIGYGGMVGVLRWQPSGGVGQRLYVIIAMDGASAAYGASGPSPLVFRSTSDPNATHSKVEITVRTDPSLAPPYVPVAYQQRFDLYATLFYNEHPPENYPGDAPPS